MYVNGIHDGSVGDNFGSITPTQPFAIVTSIFEANSDSIYSVARGGGGSVASINLEAVEIIYENHFCNGY